MSTAEAQTGTAGQSGPTVSDHRNRLDEFLTLKVVLAFCILVVAGLLAGALEMNQRYFANLLIFFLAILVVAIAGAAFVIEFDIHRRQRT